MSKISVIIPAYNSEEYIEKCLHSVINQILRDIEIIIIDDFSKDSTKNIIQRYANVDDRIVPIYLDENKRQGYARNIAMEIATGEYLAFLDSDDYIELDMLEKVYEKAIEQDFDLIMFDYFEEKGDKQKNIALDICGEISGEISEAVLQKIFTTKGYFWTKIYKRKMILENKVKFAEGYFFEDALFHTFSLAYAKRVCKIDKPFYHYIIRDESSSNVKNNGRLYHKIVINEMIFNEAKTRNLPEFTYDLILNKYMRNANANLYICLNLFDKPDVVMLKQISQNLLNNIDDFKSLDSYSKLEKKSKKYINLNNISSNLLLFKFNIDTFALKMRIYIKKRVKRQMSIVQWCNI